MPGRSKRGNFGFFRRQKDLTEPIRSFIIVGVDPNEKIIRYGEYSSLNEAKKRIAEITDTDITISVFTEANRTVYREVR